MTGWKAFGVSASMGVFWVGWGVYVSEFGGMGEVVLSMEGVGKV